MKFAKITAVVSLALASSLFAIDDAKLLKKAQESGLKPIPASQKAVLDLIDDPSNPLTMEKVELGKMLYFEPRLSKSSLISCNTCHNLALWTECLRL